MAKAIQRTFGGIVDDRFEVGKKLHVSNRLHVYKTGSGEDEQEHIEEVRDVTFTTRHTIDQFSGSEWETALAFDPTPRGQETLPEMENVELKAQPVKSIVIGREEKTYGLVMFGGRKDIALEPQHGIELKSIDIVSQHPIQLEAKWTAKGVNWKQCSTSPLMELAYNGALSVQFSPFTSAQIDTLERKARTRKSHPGQTDLTEDLAEKPARKKRGQTVEEAAAESKPRGKAHAEKYPDGQTDEQPVKRGRGRPPKAKPDIALA